MPKKEQKTIGDGTKKGRPLASPEPRDVSITIRLNKTEYEAMNTWCFRYDISVSECIRSLLEIHSIIPDNPLRQ